MKDAAQCMKSNLIHLIQKTVLRPVMSHGDLLVEEIYI